MAQGGSVPNNGAPQGNSIVNGLASVWPALNRSIQAGRAAQNTNDANALNLMQTRSSMQTMADQGLGPDPRTGNFNPRTNWDPDSFPGAPQNPDNPIGSMMQDPTTRMLMQVDPKGMMGTMAQRIMAPPVNMQVTDPSGKTYTQLLSPMQAMRMQGQGFTVAEADKAKPIDPNTAPQDKEMPDPNTGRMAHYGWSAGQTGWTRTPGVGLGDFAVKPPSGTLGDILGAQRFMSLMNLNGGGTSLPGQKGSGSPQVGALPGASSAFVGGTGASSTPAGQPQTAQPKVPTIADIFRNKMTELSRSPEEQAAANKLAEIKVQQTADEPRNAAKDEQALAAHLAELDAIDNAAMKVETAPGLPSILGGKSVTNFAALPGGEAKNALDLVDFLKNRSILTTFQSARDMSTSGGGVGRLTETELPIFANAQAQLGVGQSEAQFRDQLGALRRNVAQMKENLKTGFKKQYGRDLQYSAQVGGPAVGAVEGGYRFKGGDPRSPGSWQKLTQ